MGTSPGFCHPLSFLLRPCENPTDRQREENDGQILHARAPDPGVKNVFSTTYHPQTNGQAERLNLTILAYVANHPKEWDLYTETVAFAYNTQAHATTTLTPFDMVVSRPIPRCHRWVATLRSYGCARQSG